MLQRSASVVDGLTADVLVEYCERIAAVSGFLGGLSGVGFEERDLLTSIARDLKDRLSDRPTMASVRTTAFR
jgi:hypothetical protein